MKESASPLINLVDIKRHFRLGGDWVRAVDGVSLALREGVATAIVGESGCGKTTLSRVALLLEHADSGTLTFEDKVLSRRSPRPARLRYQRSVQPVFQDPFASLSPRLSINEIVAEPLIYLDPVRRDVARQRVRTALTNVGLDPDYYGRRLPHQLSGGERQRVAVARALVSNPRYVVLDEPLSALDMTIRGQILALLLTLKRTTGVGMLFITHDLASAAALSDEVAVMYLGRIVEMGPTNRVMKDPQHPYTRTLLAAGTASGRITSPDSHTRYFDVADPRRPPSGCHFHPRCPEALPLCGREYPRSAALADGWTVKCHLYLAAMDIQNAADR